MMQKKLKICLMLPDPYKPDFPARPAITEIYGKYLPILNNEVVWVTPTQDQTENKKQKMYGDVKIFPVYRSSSSSGFKLYDKFRYYLERYKLLKKIFEDEYDIIQVRNDMFDALIALYIKKKYKIPFVFQYSFPIDTYKFLASGTLLKMFSRLQKFILNFALKNADFILPISDTMKNQLVQRGLDPSKIATCPLGVNLDLFSNKKNSFEVQNKLKLKNSIIFLYLGSMHKLRKLDVIINAFKLVTENRDDVKLLMVGDGDDKENLKKLVSELKLEDHIIFTGQVSYFDVPDYIAAADVCLSPIPPIDLYLVSSPTKLFEYMAMGKPVIANKEIPEQEHALNFSEGGILIEFSSGAFAEGMIKMIDSQNLIKMGNKGRVWVSNNRDYKVMAIKIEKMYYRLIKKHPNK